MYIFQINNMLAHTCSTKIYDQIHVVEQEIPCQGSKDIHHKKKKSEAAI